LLGMYLGDGYVCRLPRTYRLEVYLHRADTRGIERVSRVLPALLPNRRVGRRRHGNAVVVTSYYRSWPEEFMLGCIDSDGCRHRRIVAGRNYPAYSFANHSEDILALFAEACRLAGVSCRRASRVKISIARRRDVAQLDQIQGLPADAHRPTPLDRPGVTPAKPSGFIGKPEGGGLS